MPFRVTAFATSTPQCKKGVRLVFVLHVVQSILVLFHVEIWEFYYAMAFLFFYLQGTISVIDCV